jgi:hypothetical protein
MNCVIAVSVDSHDSSWRRWRTLAVVVRVIAIVAYCRQIDISMTDKLIGMAGVYTNLVPVVSSNLKAAGWAVWCGFDLLEIEFLSGSLYLYRDVPEPVYTGLMAAPSKGRYFWANIRCKTTDCSGGNIPYTYSKLR